MSGVIVTSGLTKYYNSQGSLALPGMVHRRNNKKRNRGILDLNLQVKEGEIFGFIGPNGAGKSTTLRILLGLVAPTSGKAEVFGMETGRKQKEILARMGYLPSESMFYSGMKVSEILKLSEKLYKRECSAEQRRLCDRFSLDVHRRVGELSLGNRKKVAIVCAFQHNPELLLLDEPTSGLDPLMQREFFDLVEERNKKGATIVLSSHILPEIQQYCGRAAILREGRMIACCEVEKLVGRKCRKVEVKGVSAVPVLPGVREQAAGKDQISFLYEGEMKPLLEELSRISPEDVIITEPELEEIFLHYYEKGGAEK